MIRPYEEGDAVEISTIVRRCLKEVNIKYYPIDIINFRAYSYGPSLVRQVAKEKSIIVFEKDGKIVGTANFNPLDNYIGTVFVDPDYHRQGIGTALMKQIENVAEQHGAKTTYINSSINAVEFYKYLGYRKIRKFTHHYLGDAYEMKKNLVRRKILSIFREQ